MPSLPKTRTYRTWLERLGTGVLTLAQCRQFAAAVSPVAHMEDTGGKPHNMWGAECAGLFARIKRTPVRLTDEHAEKAEEWFRTRGRKALGMSLYVHAAICEAFDHFAFDGEYVRSENGRTIWPVWTINLKRTVSGHDALQYWAAPWQTAAYEQHLGSTAEWWWGKEGRDAT